MVRNYLKLEHLGYDPAMKSLGWTWSLTEPFVLPHPDRLGAIVYWAKLEPDFSATVEVSVIENDFRVTGLHIESRSGAELRSTHLRKVSFPEIRQFLVHRVSEVGGAQVQAQAAMLEYAEVIPEEELAHWVRSADREAEGTLASHLAATLRLSDEERRAAIEQARAISSRLAKAKPHRGRGVEKQPEELRHVALQYLYHYQEHGRRVVKAMTETLTTELSNPALPIGTVRHWVWRARKEGWLSKGEQGKAGARPGPRLIEWMKTQGIDWMKTQGDGADAHGIDSEKA